jgi:hypothetical protein
MANLTLTKVAPEIKYSKEGEPVAVRYRFPFLEANAQIGDNVYTPFIDPFDLTDSAGNRLPHAIECYLLWQYTGNYANIRTVESDSPIVGGYYNQPVITSGIIGIVYDTAARNATYFRMTDFFNPFRMITQIATVAPDDRNFMEMNFKLKGFI